MIIKATDLRIGNWVIGCNGELMQVDGYGIMTLQEEKVDYMMPVLITPEILVKIGFEKENNKLNRFIYQNDRWAYPADDDIYPVIEKDGKYYVMDVLVESAHQLQNIEYALSRKELEFTL